MTTVIKHVLARNTWIVLATAAVLSSCQQKTEGGVHIPVPKDSSALGKINHFIPVKDIEQFKSAFAVQRDSLTRMNPNLVIPVSETFNKEALLDILKDSTNVGVRIYYGVKQIGNRNEVRLMLVGVNAAGKDLYYKNGGEAGKLSAKVPPPPEEEGGVEYGQCTPPCFQEPREQ